jgi:flagellar basal-body rod protein FlgG
MSGAIYMAASGALAYEKRMEIISNNLANVNTAGYKMDEGHFRLFDMADPTGPPIEITTQTAGSQADMFWIEFNMYTDYSNGSLRNTENDFDLALVGKGFFCVQSPDGVQYTRKGEFTLNSEGVLVTQNGWPVLGDSGEIRVQSNENPHKHKKFEVDREGIVNVDGSQVDRLRIVDFPQPYQLQKTGNSLFKPMDDSIGETEAGKVDVAQGFIELSNVDAVKMMTEMIEVLRGYESYQKVIRSVDEANAKVINEVAN